MKLAIDCALRRINIAAWSDAQDATIRSVESGAKQAEALPIIVGEVLREHGAELSDVSQIVITRGPGFYTGIRVGISYAAALAYALGVDAVPISTLEAMAAGASAEGPTAAIIRARRGAVYAAIFDGATMVGSERFVETEALDRELVEKFGARGTRAIVAGFDDVPALECARETIDASSSVPIGMIAISARAKATSPQEIRAVYLREVNG